MPNSFASIADVSARAVATVFVVLSVGAALTIFGKIDRKGIQAISTTLNYIFVPAILLNSFAAGLSVDNFKFAWVLVIFGIMVIPVSVIVAYPLMILAKTKPWFRSWFMFGQVFQNTVALPLVFVGSICNEVVFYERTSDGLVIPDGNGSFVIMSKFTCVKRGELYIFLYIFINSLLFWVIAFDVMPKGTTMEEEAVAAALALSQKPNDNAPTTQAGKDGNVEPSVLDATKRNIRKSIAEMRIKQQQEADFVSGSFYGGNAAMERKRYERGHEDELENSSQDDVEIANLEHGERSSGTITLINNNQVNTNEKGEDAVVESSDDNKTNHRGTKRGGKKTWGKTIAYRIMSIFLRPPILSQMIGMFVGLIAPLQAAFYSPTSVLRPVTVALEIFAQGGVSMTNLSMAAGLGMKIKSLKKFRHLLGGGEEEDALSQRTTFFFVLGRMLVLPAVIFAITYLLSPFLPDDRMLHLVLYIEAITPSANMVVVVPQILNNHKASDALSLLLLLQYFLALPTMLCWISLAFYLTANLH